MANSKDAEYLIRCVSYDDAIISVTNLSNQTNLSNDNLVVSDHISSNDNLFISVANPYMQSKKGERNMANSKDAEYLIRWGIEKKVIEKHVKVEIEEVETIIKSIQSIIMKEKDTGVTCRKLSSLEKESYYFELSKKAAKFDFQKHLLLKLKLMLKQADVDDWCMAWTVANEPILKVGPLDPLIQNQFIYKVYAELCHPMSENELDKQLNKIFPSNHKAIEDIIERIKDDVYNEIERKKPISIVKYHALQGMINQSITALARQDIYSHILLKIYNVNNGNISSTFISRLLSVAELDEWTLLEAYQYLQGHLNEIDVIHNRVKQFANWYQTL